MTKKFKYIPAKKIDLNYWKNIIEASPTDNIFFQWWYMNICAENWGIISNASGDIVMPVFHSFSRKLKNSPYIPYTTIITTDRQNLTLNNDIIRAIRKKFLYGSIIIDKNIKAEVPDIIGNSEYYQYDMINSNITESLHPDIASIIYESQNNNYYIGKKLSAKALFEWIKENNLLNRTIKPGKLSNLLKIAEYHKFLKIVAVYTKQSKLFSAVALLDYKSHLNILDFWSKPGTDKEIEQAFWLSVSNILESYKSTNKVLRLYKHYSGHQHLFARTALYPQIKISAL